MVYLDPDNIDFTTFMPEMDEPKDKSQKVSVRTLVLA